MHVVRCRKCNYHFLDLDEKEGGLVFIKKQGLKQIVIINTKKLKKEKKDMVLPIIWKGRYMFEILNSQENLIRIQCERCRHYFIVNLDTEKMYEEVI